MLRVIKLGSELLFGVRCVLGRIANGLQSVVHAGHVVIGINGIGTDDLETGTKVFSATYFSAWLRSMNSVRPHRGSVVKPSAALPQLNSSKSFIERSDQYFGVLKYENNGRIEYLWHCSAQNSTTKQARMRGKHMQLLSVAKKFQTAGTNSSDQGDHDTWHLEYPADLVLDRDQAAHNMCLVDWETKSAIDRALRVSEAEREGILTYGLGGQYVDSHKHFKNGLHVYALTKPSSNSTALFVKK